jgi:hypothetical protein
MHKLEAVIDPCLKAIIDPEFNGDDVPRYTDDYGILSSGHGRGICSLRGHPMDFDRVS